ncbi:MAG: DsrE/DsrF/DrsH-like family protein, partial [Clostridia bacterium]|nr:DsrE/DsrF/DrsH-like family protein [Clostridia bacterium]
NSDEIIILDVRTAVEVAIGKIDNSINIPLNDIRSRLNELDKDKLVVVYCAVGFRAYLAIRILMQNGFTKVKNLAGGFTTYGITTTNYNDCYFNNLKDECERCSPSEPADIDINECDIIKLNACGLQCPGPIMMVYEKMSKLNDGDVLEIKATDPGFAMDIESWCDKTFNTYIRSEKQNDSFVVRIRKGTDKRVVKPPVVADNKSMVVFSGDLDKALATFIIANGAAAMGKKVTLFFTFWGLNILRKPEKVKVKKNIIEKMFGFMLPRGASELTLSKMDMGGMGTKMMKMIMKKKNVNSLEELIQSAVDNGVTLIACTMSMDIMGIKKEELIDGVQYAGVATFLGASEDSNMTLFI